VADLAARTFAYRTDQAQVDQIAEHEWGERIIFTGRDEWTEINEVTLIYRPAGGRQGRPRVRTTLAEMDDTQRQLYDALDLQTLAPTSIRSHTTRHPETPIPQGKQAVSDPRPGKSR
jgi:hypothetical protein